MSIQLRDKSTCKYDQISLGEVMLRLDPGEGRIRTARHFTAWEGGGEYNTSRGLRKCFGYKTAVCTAFVDNEVGHLIEDFIMQGGVATDFIKWREDDGIGRSVRNGLNFTERGFGIRGAVGVPDRGNSAAAQLKPGDFDWDRIFGKIGTRWLHTGGIFAALSETTAALTIEVVKAAKKHGVVVSYDLNYRPSLWKSIGGLKKAQEVNREIAKYVDVMIGNEEDFTASLGFEVKGADHSLSHIETDAFKAMIETAVKAYPNFKVAATTLRRVITATKNDWSAAFNSGQQSIRSAGGHQTAFLTSVPIHLLNALGFHIGRDHLCVSGPDARCGGQRPSVPVPRRRPSGGLFRRRPALFLRAPRAPARGNRPRPRSPSAHSCPAGTKCGS
jgi:2-dehydro-3-deoxygluconokinase